MKIGDKVKIISGSELESSINDIGEIIKKSPIPQYDWQVRKSDGTLESFYEHNLMPISKSTCDPTYELLKPVSIKALEEAGACERELHRFAFLVLKYAAEKYNASLGYNERIGGNTYSLRKIDDLILSAALCKGGIRFLLDKGFIVEKIERPNLKVDDRVIVGGRNRYFSGWAEDGSMEYFILGNTSWSNTSSTIGTTRNWKLPD